MTIHIKGIENVEPICILHDVTPREVIELAAGLRKPDGVIDMSLPRTRFSPHRKLEHPEDAQLCPACKEMTYWVGTCVDCGDRVCIACPCECEQ